MRTDIKVPFISRIEIIKKVESFRQKYWGDKIPLDIEKIIEQKLEIEILPIPNLLQFCSVNALITSDWSKIYVDNEKYMDDRYLTRLRFSLAHEIGHFVLHKELYASFGIKSFENFYKFVESIDDTEYGFIETQANSFAGYLLIPDFALLPEKEKILTGKKLPKGVDAAMLNNVLADELCRIFNVSAQACENALNRPR
ncbi:MAG: ImmA/IrrE family metallo-endopeptidase [Patescibacteria group bacterium]